MKNILKIFTVTCLAAGIQIASGQVSSLPSGIWQIKSATNLLDGQTFHCNGSFEFAESFIRFSQKQGAVNYEFRIRKVVDKSLDDSMEYEIDFRGATGTIKLEKQNESASLLIELSKGHQRVLPYKFLLQKN